MKLATVARPPRQTQFNSKVMTTITSTNSFVADQVPLYLVEQIDKPSVLSVLHSSTLLNALTPAEIDRLASVSKVVRVKRGDVLWLKGSQVDYMGIAATGFIKMVRSCSNGSEVTMELFGPGQMFGLCGALCGVGCPLSAVAVTDLWYLRIPKREFLEIYAANNLFKDRMVRRLSVRLQKAHDMISHLSGGRVEERIAAVLFMLAESYGQERKRGVLLRVPLTRQEISEMAGTTVESTIRTMSRWQKEGVLTTQHHYITILKTEELGQLAAR